MNTAREKMKEKKNENHFGNAIMLANILGKNEFAEMAHGGCRAKTFTFLFSSPPLLSVGEDVI